MRNQALYAIVAMAALFFVNGCQKPVVEPPTLKLDTTEFSAKAEGEVVSVPYTLTNGVEGSEVSVKPAAASVSTGTTPKSPGPPNSRFRILESARISRSRSIRLQEPLLLRSMIMSVR